MPRNRLTPKQQRFVAEFLIDLNATAAYQRAGYQANGESARRTASRLLTNVDVQAAIARGKQAQAERTGITADRVLQEIARLAFVDVRKLYGVDGSLKPIPALDDDTAAALSSLEVDELREWDGNTWHSVGQTKKLKLWDKTANLTLLAKHLRLLVEQVEHTHEPGEGLAALVKEIAGEHPHTTSTPAPDSAGAA